MKEKKITKKQSLFIDYYIDPDNKKDGIGCYQKAFPNSSLETARTNAGRLLKRDDIKKEIMERDDKRKLETAPLKSQLLDFYKDLMNSSPVEFYNEDGTVKPLATLPPNKARLIKEVKRSPHNGKISTYVLFDKMDAMEFYTRLEMPEFYDKNSKLKIETDNKMIGVLAVPAQMTVDEWIDAGNANRAFPANKEQENLEKLLTEKEVKNEN